MVRTSGAGIGGAGHGPAAGGALVACTSGPPAEPKPATPPNIVSILADDLGYGEVKVELTRPFSRWRREERIAGRGPVGRWAPDSNTAGWQGRGPRGDDCKLSN